MVVSAERVVGLDQMPHAGLLIGRQAGGQRHAAGRIEVLVVLTDHEVPVEVVDHVAARLVLTDPVPCLVSGARTPGHLDRT